MEAKEIIERLCQLQAEVQQKIGFEHSADCFCKQSGFWGAVDCGGTHAEGYRNDGIALEFIEKVVREKLDTMPSNAELTSPHD
jgi:hypothetical protein